MFENKFITKGVSAEIPFYMQNLMWFLIESMEISKKDYLQVFELKKVVTNGKSYQKIIHRQEQPKYEKEFTISLNEKDIVESKIFVIDDITHCTMLLAEEY